ncbi:E3 ubiquitin-protein ligase TRIM71-like [Magallana gigas]|uniref:E3 ubiquitin-protein ligase TRIM71-like n=1 Tax=Magallana gigas TaxID=29159 RepID=UPI00333EFF97
MDSIPDDAQHIIECGTESCERYGAMYCNSCYRSMCEQCRDDHLKIPDNKGHDVVQYLSRNHKIPVEKCKKHPTKDLDLLCEECQIPLCSKCASQETHTRHKFHDLEKFYSENCHSCLKTLPSIQNYFIPTSKELQTEIQENKEEIKRVMEKTRKEVKEDTEFFKKLADKAMSETLEEIDRVEEKLLEELKSQDKTVDEYITYLQKLDREIREYLSASKVTNIIIEHSKNLEIRPIPKTTKPVTPTYTVGKYSKEEVSNLLGKLHVDQTKPELRRIKALESCTSTSKEVKGEYQKASNVQQTESPSASVIKVRELTVPGVERLFHLSIDTAEKVWASDNSGYLVQTDLQGNMLQEINTSRQGVGYHTVTENADLIYADRENKVIYKKSMDLKEVSPFIRTDWEPISIHSSHKNGGIFVGMKKTTGARNSDAKVVKYSKYGSYLHSIHRDNDRNLYSEPHYITENINGDICTSDSGKQEVVVVNEARQHRFSYRGQRSAFNPYGICTDTLGHIIVCDGYFNNGTIDIIDTDGEFLTHLVSQSGIIRPYSVCVDDKNNLYVGYSSSNTINVYKYLQ